MVVKMRGGKVFRAFHVETHSYLGDRVRWYKTYGRFLTCAPTVHIDHANIQYGRKKAKFLILDIGYPLKGAKYFLRSPICCAPEIKF